MEPITHALTSVALGRAGLNKLTRAATPMLLVSGTIADIDWFTRFGGPAALLHGYRTATHSLAGTAVIAVAVAAAFWVAWRGSPKFATPLRIALLICAIGAGVHLLMDMLNPYGLKLMWPFSQQWYGWDLADSVDAWIIFFLLVGLLTPELFRLILQEIGSKPKKTGRQRGAIFGLACILLFVAGRALAHERAVSLLDSREYGGQTPLAVGAFPHSSNPLMWSGIVETDNSLVVLDVPLGPLSIFDPDAGNVFFKPEQSAPLRSAITSPVGVEFLGYARFPLAHVEPVARGFQVRLRDMRFASESPGRRGIMAIVDVTPDGAIAGQRLEFDAFSSR